MKNQNTAAVPNLPHRCGSWIGTSPDGRVREFFARPSAVVAASFGWKVETALDYLCRINATARAGSR
jgi:hypothetical protein